MDDNKKSGKDKGDTQGKKDNHVIDMLLSKNAEQTSDYDTMILDTQKRIWNALKNGYEYTDVIAESDTFLRKNAFVKMSMVTLYVDLVGSTTMTLEMPAERIATIISSFSQEMAAEIRRYHGYVLKFAGDAVIGYFVAGANGLQAAENAANCAKSMIGVLSKGINPVLDQYDYPELKAKVGADYGQNMVVRYGSDVRNAHVDIIGPAMNIAAKMQGMAKPNQVLIGGDIYERLHPDQQKNCVPIVWTHGEWRYRSRRTGEIYMVYEFK